MYRIFSLDQSLISFLPGGVYSGVNFLTMGIRLALVRCRTTPSQIAGILVRHDFDLQKLKNSHSVPNQTERASVWKLKRFAQGLEPSGPSGPPPGSRTRAGGSLDAWHKPGTKMCTNARQAQGPFEDSRRCGDVFCCFLHVLCDLKCFGCIGRRGDRVASSQ